MGYFTGFVCHLHTPRQYTNQKFTGFTLTTTLLYLTIQVHRSTRQDQRNAIHQQVQILNTLSAPTGAWDRRLAPSWRHARPQNLDAGQEKEKETEKQPAMEDMLKHRWNKEVERLAHKAYESRWEDVRNTAVEGWRAAKRLVRGDDG